MLMFFAVPVFADERFVHVERTQIPTRKRIEYFGVKYAVQWTFYLTTQYETIQDHGSFRNWQKNPLSPHFDRDNFENNVIRHTLAGASYYLFYRSRGYSESQAFLWSNLSSLAFEFTIETFTERPSYQDLALTPTLGTVAGIGAEKLSAYFHEKKVLPGRILGFLFNPYSVLPRASYEFRAIPVIREGHFGALLEWRY